MGINLTNNCVAWWKFDEIEQPGNQILDASGNGHHGTLNLNGGSATIGTGLIGNSVYCNEGQSIAIPGHSDFDFGLNPGEGFSILCWIKSNGMTDYMGEQCVATHCFISRSLAQNPGDATAPWIFSIEGPPLNYDRLSLTLNFEDSSEIITGNGKEESYFADGEWHCCIITIKRTDNTLSTRFYLDGLPNGLANRTLSPTDRLKTTASNDLIIGAFVSMSSLVGWLDSFAIFDRQLTEAEATWLYNEGAGRDTLRDAVVVNPMSSYGTNNKIITNVYGIGLENNMSIFGKKGNLL